MPTERRLTPGGMTADDDWNQEDGPLSSLTSGAAGSMDCAGNAHGCLPFHVVAEGFDLAGCNVLIRRHLYCGLYLLVAFRWVIGNIDHDIEEHLSLDSLKAPELVSFIYSIDPWLELS